MILEKIIYEGISFYNPKFINDPRRQGYCQAKIRSMLKQGTLEKQPCEICNKIDKVVAHHEDYSNPINIRWLCHRHHVAIHCIFKRLNA